MTKEVIFSEWCKRCANWGLEESEDPCNDCLAQGWNEYTTKPLYFEEGE